MELKKKKKKKNEKRGDAVSCPQAPVVLRIIPNKTDRHHIIDIVF